MSPETLDAIARIEAQTFVRQVDWFAEIGSTNDYALSVADDASVITPRLIWADRQHAGRGRSGAEWWSAAGALTFSLLVDRDDWQLPAARWPQVSLVTGLAIAEALSELLPGYPVQVKWPNDVYLDGRKVCGILIETAAGTQRLIVGIGINVANSFRSAPAELQQTATSIIDHRPAAALPVAVLLAVLDHWERRMMQFCEAPAAFTAEWADRCLLTGKPIRLTTGSTTIIGICTGIDDHGRLQIDTPQGLHQAIAGTVRLLTNPARS